MAVRSKAMVCFFIFIIILLKYFLVNYLHIIPYRSPANRIISWFMILPLIFLGSYISLQIVRDIFFSKKAKPSISEIIYILLSLPVLFWALYLFLGLVSIPFFIK